MSGIFWRLSQRDLVWAAEDAWDEIEQLRTDLAEAVDACRYALADSPRWRECAETVVADYEQSSKP